MARLSDMGGVWDMATMAAVLRRYAAAEAAQVERARERVVAEREAAVATAPTAERVDAAVRGALAGRLGQTLVVRVGRGARGESAEVRLVALHRAGALCRTERGGPVWLSYRDLYAAHATVLAPVHIHGAVQRAVARLRRGAPRGDAR